MNTKAKDVEVYHKIFGCRLHNFTSFAMLSRFFGNTLFKYQPVCDTDFRSYQAVRAMVFTNTKNHTIVIYKQITSKLS